MTVDSGASATGPVRVVIPDDRPGAGTSTPGSVLTSANISRAPFAGSSRATIAVTLSADGIGADASDLRLVRYDESTDSWERLDAEVVGSAEGTVTIEATTSETSMFAVSGPAADQQSDESTPEPTADADLVRRPRVRHHRGVDRAGRCRAARTPPT